MSNKLAVLLALVLVAGMCCVCSVGATLTTVQVNASYNRNIQYKPVNVNQPNLIAGGNTSFITINTPTTALISRVTSNATSDKYDFRTFSGITFKAGTIPADGIIRSANVTTFLSTTVSALGATSSCVVDFSPANKTSFTTGDFSNTTFSLQAGCKPTPSAINASIAYPLNADGLSKIKSGDYVTFGLEQNRTLALDYVWAASASSRFELRPLEFSGGAYGPTLYYTYEQPSVPEASFTRNASVVVSPGAVAFNDTSYGIPTSWYWEFGDGSTSTDQNPVHTYSTVGTFTVNMKATNGLGSSWNNGTAVKVANTFYYAYGDSITAGNAGPNPIDGNGSYMMLMGSIHTPQSMYDHNMDGSGMSSGWGWENLPSHYNKSMKKFYIMFGANDLPAAFTGINTTVMYSVKICNYVLNNGTACYVMFPPLQTSGVNSTQEIMYPIATANLTAQGMTVIQTADATDLHPGDGIVFGYNASNTYDGTHPNPVGHRMIADYLWDYISSEIVSQITPPGPLSLTYPTGQLFTDASAGSPTAWDWQFNDIYNNNTWITFNTSQNPYAVFGPSTYTIRLNASNTYGYNISTQYTLLTVHPANTSAIKLSPTNINAAANTKQNVTVYVSNLTDVKAVMANVTFNSDVVGITNAYLNISLSGATLAAVYDNSTGWVKLNVSNTTFNVGTTPIPIADIEFATRADVGSSESTYIQHLWYPNDTLVSPTPFAIATAGGVFAQNSTVVASFTQDKMVGQIPLTVQFTDTSTNATAWTWKYQNLTAASATTFSTAQNPSQVFSLLGNYSISLFVTGPDGYGSSNTSIGWVNTSNTTYSKVTKSSYITVLPIPDTTATFTANQTYGTSNALPVQFNYTGSFTGVTWWNWSFGDGVFTNASTAVTANASHAYSGFGIYPVALTVSNAGGTSTYAVSDYVVLANPTVEITPYNQPINVNQKAKVQAVMNGLYRTDNVVLNVTYNTTALNVTPSINTTSVSGWSILSSTATVNPSAPEYSWLSVNISKPNNELMTATPVLDLEFWAKNSTNSTQPINYAESAWSNVVIANSSYAPDGLFITNRTSGMLAITNETYTKRINFRDLNNRNLITDIKITVFWTGSASTGTATTTNGYITISSTYDVIALNATADLYYELSQDITIDSNEDTDVYMVPLQGFQQSKLNVLYPREVRFTCTDNYGNAIKEMNVTAVEVNSTFDNTNWITQLFGISSAATPIEGTYMIGATDDQGTVAFPMIASGQYTLRFVKASEGVNAVRTIHPDQQQYIMVFGTTGSAEVLNSLGYVNGTLIPVEITTGYVNLNLSYNDSTFTTTSITFYVNFPNATSIYSVTSPATPGTNQTFNASYQVTNNAGDAYVWGYFADNTRFGNISGSQGITLKGTGQPMLDLFTFRGHWG